MTLAEKALDIARSQIGVEEVPRGSNRGPMVDKFISSVGLDPAGKHAWCTAFVYWCFEQAAIAMGRTNPLAKTGGVHDLWNKRKDKFRVTFAQPGDLVFMDFGKGKGHLFFVENVTDLDYLTVEGNTNPDGGREGYGVFDRERAILSFKMLGILRFQ